MKNVTITLSEDVARWARIFAAQHETSVSRLLGDMLRRRMEEEEGYEIAMKAFLGRKPKVLKKGGTYPQREDLHERDMLR